MDNRDIYARMKPWGSSEGSSSNKLSMFDKHSDLKGNNRRQFEFFYQYFEYELKNSNKVILEMGRYDVKTRDLVLLQPGNWLNDMNINYYGLILSSEDFKIAMQKKGFNKGLFAHEFLILNTFVGINLVNLEDSYMEYYKIKVLENDSHSFDSEMKHQYEEEDINMVKQQMMMEAKSYYIK